MPVFVSFDQGFQGAVDEIALFVPRLLAAALVLAIGWLLARAVGRLVARVLEGAGADRALADSPAAGVVGRLAPEARPAAFVGALARWFVLGLAAILAVDVLDVTALSDALASIVGYLPNVVAAALIVIVALAIAAAVAGSARRLMHGTLLGRIVETAVPALVMVIALFMALVQLQVAEEIVVATYVLVLGAVALGFALAFGLGGRDVAGRMLLAAYQGGQERAPQMRREYRTVRARAQAEVEERLRREREEELRAQAEVEAAAAAEAAAEAEEAAREAVLPEPTDEDEELTPRDDVTPTIPGGRVGAPAL